MKGERLLLSFLLTYVFLVTSTPRLQASHFISLNTFQWIKFEVIQQSRNGVTTHAQREREREMLITPGNKAGK